MYKLLKKKLIYDELDIPDEGVITFLNPFSYFIARQHQDLFENVDGIMIDGSLLCFLLRVRGHNVKRVSFDMTSLAPKVFLNASQVKKSIYFLGSTTEEVEDFVEYVQGEYPDIKVVGCRSGYFSNLKEKKESIISIVELAPDIVVVGMGTPLQEEFLLMLRGAGWRGQGFTCGGFFHQTSARGGKYYPKWIDKLNLRWLYRMWDEPKLLKRYFLYYPVSVVLFFKDSMKRG